MPSWLRRQRGRIAEFDIETALPQAPSDTRADDAAQSQLHRVAAISIIVRMKPCTLCCCTTTSPGCAGTRADARTNGSHGGGRVQHYPREPGCAVRVWRHFERMRFDAAALHVPFPSDPGWLQSRLLKLGRGEWRARRHASRVLVRNKGGQLRGPGSSATSI